LSGDPFPFSREDTRRIRDWVDTHIASSLDPKNRGRPAPEPDLAIGEAITPEGIGAGAAFWLFTNIIQRDTRPFGHFDATLGAAVVFAGDMGEADMIAWAEGHRRSRALLCLPTCWRGEMVSRLCIVNPQTDPDHVMSVLETLQ